MLDKLSFLPRQALRCRGRSSRHRSDAVTCRERWGLRRRPAGCRYRGEHPGNIIKGEVRGRSVIKKGYNSILSVSFGSSGSTST